MDLTHINENCDIAFCNRSLNIISIYRYTVHGLILYFRQFAAMKVMTLHHILRAYEEQEEGKYT